MNSSVFWTLPLSDRWVTNGSAATWARRRDGTRAATEPMSGRRRVTSAPAAFRRASWAGERASDVLRMTDTQPGAAFEVRRRVTARSPVADGAACAAPASMEATRPAKSVAPYRVVSRAALSRAGRGVKWSGSFFFSLPRNRAVGGPAAIPRLERKRRPVALRPGLSAGLLLSFAKDRCCGPIGPTRERRPCGSPAVSCPSQWEGGDPLALRPGLAAGLPWSGAEGTILRIVGFPGTRSLLDMP